MKKNLIALTLLLIATSGLSAEVSNPATPGSKYNGTTDLEVMRMLIFSCHENCNSRYLESLYEDKIKEEDIPEGGHLPFLLMPNGTKVEKINFTKDYKPNPYYIYPSLKEGMTVHYIVLKQAKGSSNGSLSITYPITELDGQLRILRPIYYKPKESQPVGGDQ